MKPITMTTATLYKLFLSLLLYFLPISVMIHVVLIFIAVDFITGIYASVKTHQKIVSSRLRKTIEKFAFYSIAIMASYMFQIHFIPWTNLSTIVASYIALTELFSIYENINVITNLDILTRVKTYLTESLKTLTEKK